MGNWIAGWYNDTGPPPAKKRKLSDGSSVIGGSLYEKDQEINYLHSQIKRSVSTYYHIEG